MAVEGVLVLVTDANRDGFAGPSDTAFVQSDDVMIAKWDIAGGGGNAPGVFQGSTGSVSFSGDWGEGDPLAIFWFPTLSAADAAPGASVPYGTYRATTTPGGSNPNGSDSWTTPEDGISGYSLIFLTTDADVLNPGGDLPSTAGEAMNFTPGDGPAAPSGTAGVVNGLAIDVTWTDNLADETGYRVERSVFGSGVWMIVGEMAAGTSLFSDDTVAGSTEYVYRVLAMRGPSQSVYDTSDPIQSAAASARFTNLSTRALVQTGDNILIASFRVEGGPLRIYARAIGPGLAGAGIVGFLADPTMELRKISDGSLVAVNDNWRSDQEQAIMDTSIPPGDDAESAIIANLSEEGFYSVVVRGVGDTTGFANVELYEFVDPAEPVSGKLTNLSTRALVQTGDNILIASFQVTGDAPQRVYSRAIGPGLAGAGISGFLVNPIMELRKVPENTLLRENDSWKSDQQSLIESTTIQPGDDIEAALVATVEQNSLYSIVVRGVNDGEGFANVEVYNFPE